MKAPDAFLGEGPNPSLSDKLALFGQFVGSWDLSVTNHPPGGDSTIVAAEWHFAWALGGRWPSEAEATVDVAKTASNTRTTVLIRFMFSPPNGWSVTVWSTVVGWQPPRKALNSPRWVTGRSPKEGSTRR